jgi:alpha-tubulin suppressor-like RCC1 family protein
MTDEAFSFAFGWNGFGQVGTTGTRQQVNEPERLELRTDDIEAADDYEMAQRSREDGGGAECSPYAMVDIATGPFHTAAVDAGGRLWTWGNGRDGQLGHPLNLANALENAEERVPRCLRLPGARFSLVACGTSHTLALTRDGQAFAWGANSRGQLGIEAHSTALNELGFVVRPEPIPDISGIVLISAGGESSCAIVQTGALNWLDHSEELPAAAGTVASATGAAAESPPPAPNRRSRLLTWGSNESGQLGRMPLRTAWTHEPGDTGLDEPTDVALGSDHIIALASGGMLYASGRGSAGQLGSGSKRSLSSFARLEAPLLQGYGPFCKVAAGMSSSAAVAYDGRLYVWGDNTSSQLGLGDDETRVEPTPTSIVGCADVGIGDECCVCVVEDAAGNATLFAVGHSGGGRLGIGDVPLILTTRAATTMQKAARLWLSRRRVAAKRRSVVGSVLISAVEAVVARASETMETIEGVAMSFADDGPSQVVDDEQNEDGVMYWDELYGGDAGQEIDANSQNGDDGGGADDEYNHSSGNEGDNVNPRVLKAPTGGDLAPSFYLQIVSCFHDEAWPPIKQFEPVKIPDESWHSVLRLRKLAVGGCHVVGCGWLTLKDGESVTESTPHVSSSKNRAGWYASLQFHSCERSTCDVRFPEPLIGLHRMICKAVDVKVVDKDDEEEKDEEEEKKAEPTSGAAVEPQDTSTEGIGSEEHANEAVDPPETPPPPTNILEDADAVEVETPAKIITERAPPMKVIRKRIGGGWKNILVPDTDAVAAQKSGKGSTTAPSGGKIAAGAAMGAARALRNQPP